MKVLYIGQFSDGTTSKMRGETLRRIAAPTKFDVIDTHIPFYQNKPIWRSVAFRYKWGKTILDTNQFIINGLKEKYDLIWVDKGVFIKPKVTRILKSRTNCLIHYTPDTAFFNNSSRFFNKSLKYYDYVITTKSFEKEKYLEFISSKQLIFKPQGFNKKLHYPRFNFTEKKFEVVFIGLYERSRARIIELLLKNKIPVAVAGKNWDNFNSVHKNNKHFRFIADGLFGEEYAYTISRALFSLGLLSKRFPELHTTRTFEIPACGTALLTERNNETSSFFKEDEVLFYENEEDLVNKVLTYKSDYKALQKITEKGRERVIQNGYDYDSIIKGILNTILK